MSKGEGREGREDVGRERRSGENRGKREVAQEIQAELEDHLERRTRVLEGRGLARAEARAEALRRFGDAHKIEEELMTMAARRRRRALVGNALEAGRRDVQQAVRGLVRQPVYALTVIVTMALGTGAAMSIFGLVNAVLIRPLPYDDPDRVVRVYNSWEGTPDAALSPAEYFDYLDGSTEVFMSFGVWTSGAVNVTEGGDPERVPASFVSAGALEAMGVAAVRGRLFGEGDDQEGSAVAILSHGFWQRRFGGAPDIVGRQIVVNGVSQAIAGVMPPEFEMPDGFVPGGRRTCCCRWDSRGRTSSRAAATT